MEKSDRFQQGLPSYRWPTEKSIYIGFHVQSILKNYGYMRVTMFWAEWFLKGKKNTRHGWIFSVLHSQTLTQFVLSVNTHTQTHTHCTCIQSLSSIWTLSLRPSREQLRRLTRCSLFSMLSSCQLKDPAVSPHEASWLLWRFKLPTNLSSTSQAALTLKLCSTLAHFSLKSTYTCISSLLIKAC